MLYNFQFSSYGTNQLQVKHVLHVIHKPRMLHAIIYLLTRIPLRLHAWAHKTQFRMQQANRDNHTYIPLAS